MPENWINNLISYYNKLGNCEAEGEDIQAFAAQVNDWFENRFV